MTTSYATFQRYGNRFRLTLATPPLRYPSRVDLIPTILRSAKAWKVNSYLQLSKMNDRKIFWMNKICKKLERIIAVFRWKIKHDFARSAFFWNWILPHFLKKESKFFLHVYSILPPIIQIKCNKSCKFDFGSCEKSKSEVKTLFQDAKEWNRFTVSLG